MYKIAEIGINHNGDLSIAMDMIRACKFAGFDCVKFQKRNVKKNLDKTQLDTFRYTPYGYIPYADWKNKLEFGLDEYKEIDKFCKTLDIQWTASVWDVDSIDFMVENFEEHIPFLKIPSARLCDKDMIGALKKYNIPVIASTGMSTMDDVNYFICELHDKIMCMMYCRSIYPTSPNDVNLETMKRYKYGYFSNVRWGYSSHDIDMMPILLASSMSDFLELHVTLDRDMYGSDQKMSWKIKTTVSLFKEIEKIENIMGKFIPIPLDKEIPAMKKLRV